jgi:hypothetical protein
MASGTRKTGERKGCGEYRKKMTGVYGPLADLVKTSQALVRSSHIVKATSGKTVD